jgi:hypothetical protein
MIVYARSMGNDGQPVIEIPNISPKNSSMATPSLVLEMRLRNIRDSMLTVPI